MKKNFLFTLILISGAAYASDPWACVSALGQSDSNNPNQVGCNSNTGTSTATSPAAAAAAVVAPPAIAPAANVAPAPQQAQTKTWLFIGNNNNSGITQCRITANGVNLATCNNVMPSKTTAKGFSYPTGMSVSKNTLYITNDYKYITQCTISANGLDADSCFKTEIIGTYSIQNPEIISNTFLLTTDKKIHYCPLNNVTIDNTKCKNFAMGDSDKSITGMTIANNMVYLVRNGDWQQPDIITQCSIDSTGIIDTTTCSSVTPTGVGQIKDSQDIKIYNNMAYITGREAVTTCNLNSNKSIDAASCHNYAVAGGSSFKSSVLGDNKLYTISGSAEIAVCNLTSTGIDTKSCQVLKPAGDGSLGWPGAIAIY
ncbi:MAG: hypothetical protein QG673_738 [Pseudomonadota bacterium]|jgi:hypothetical protein|nr:hypothetical protein [Pseudomonadota bacterium]